MTTATNLLVILFCVSALYTILGLACGVAEKLQKLVSGPRQPQQNRQRPLRRAPKLPLTRTT